MVTDREQQLRLLWLLTVNSKRLGVDPGSFLRKLYRSQFRVISHVTSNYSFIHTSTLAVQSLGVRQVSDLIMIIRALFRSHNFVKAQAIPPIKST